jgi:hypothetical protein
MAVPGYIAMKSGIGIRPITMYLQYQVAARLPEDLINTRLSAVILSREAKNQHGVTKRYIISRVSLYESLYRSED